MSRLHSKCMFASFAMHALLVALLVISSAFVKPPPPKDDVKFIKMFKDATITDSETSGGGNPNVPSDTPPAAPVVAPPAPAPAPAPVIQTPPVVVPEIKPEPKPEVKKTDPIPEPVKPKDPPPKKIVKPEPEKKVDLSKKVEAKKPDPVEPKKHVIVPNLTPKKVTVDPDAQRKRTEELRRERQEREERARAAAEERRAAVAHQMAVAEANANARKVADARRRAIDSALGNVEKNLSGGTLVEMPGPGGEAFINYADLIFGKYYQAWQTPDGIGNSSVRAKIVVARDGNILSATIIKKSGNAALDKSVQQALDRVRSLPPFPTGARDERREFNINFILHAKRQFG